MAYDALTYYSKHIGSGMPISIQPDPHIDKEENP